MKKIISAALSLLMVLGLFASCGAKKNEALANATAYLENMYQTGTKGEAMNLGMDKDVLAAVAVDGVSYSVEWTVTVTKGASDSVKIAESEKANHVKIDIPDLPEEDILFTATATVKDEKGATESVNFEYSVKGLNVPTGDEGDGTASVPTTDEPTTSTPGTDNNPTTSTKPGDKNPTTSSKPGTTTSKPSTQAGFNPTGKTAAQIMEAAYKLGRNEFMLAPTTLTGKVISVDKPYDAQYGSVSVTMVVDGSGKSIKCWQMKGNDTDKVKAGDTITVTGYITNFYYDAEDNTGDVEFTYHKDSKTEVVMNKRVAGKEEAKTYKMVTSPKVGVAYKFGFEQTALGKTLYATGAMQGFYMGTTETASVAVDVYLEKATGGYYLYTKIEGKKMYFNIETSADGAHVNAVFKDKADMVFTYDATMNTLITSKEVLKSGEGGIYGFGTYGNYTTIGTSKTSYDTNYYCHFYN